MENNSLAQGNFDSIVLTQEESEQIVSKLYDEVDTLQRLSEEIQKSDAAAKAAISAAKIAEAQAKTVKNKADNLQEVRALHKKDAIEELQGTVKDMAESMSTTSDAQIKLADAQKQAADAQRISFQCQEQIGKLTKAMIQIGCTSMAANRLMVTQLESILSDGSKEKLTDRAREELLNVITQIKEQQDILGQQEQLAQAVGEHDSRLDEMDATDEAQDAQISQNKHQIEKNIEDLLKQKDKDIEHDNRLDEIDATDEAQDGLILQNRQQIHENKEALLLQQGKDIEHDRRLDELKAELEKVKEENMQMRGEIVELVSASKKKVWKTISALGGTFGLIAIIIELIQIFS